MPKIIRTVALALLAIGLAGCTTTARNETAREVLAEHQCMREASNRPDELQRKAECQLRHTLPPPASQRRDS